MIFMEKQTMYLIWIPVCFVILMVYAFFNLPPSYEEGEFTGGIIDKYGDDHLVIRNGSRVLQKEVDWETYNSCEIGDTISVEIEKKTDLGGHRMVSMIFVGMTGFIMSSLALIAVEYHYWDRRMSSKRERI